MEDEVDFNGVEAENREKFLKKIRREKKKIFKETKENMTATGTYRAEFDTIINRYAEMRVQYDMLNDRWYESGCKITEKYTNKAGATNERKTALYLSIEKLRAELADMEDVFGLTPKGLKAIKKKGLEQSKKKTLDSFLSG